MARKKSDARETLTAQLVDIFFEFGFDGTSLSIISERTGLGRASIYHHFPGGKTEMARAVLEYADRWGEEHVRQLVADPQRSPSERLQQLLHNLDVVHHRPEQLSPANAFVLGAARADFAPHVQWHFHGLVWLMTELMQACGLSATTARRRAWEYRMLWEGGLVCARVLGDMSLFRSVMQRMPSYLLAPEDHPGILAPDAEVPRMIPAARPSTSD